MTREQNLPAKSSELLRGEKGFPYKYDGIFVIPFRVSSCWFGAIKGILLKQIMLPR